MPGPPGELRGLVREPERLLAPADRAPLAGQRVELAAGDQDEHRGDRTIRRDEPRAEAAGGREIAGSESVATAAGPRPTRRSSRPSPCPTTAANWWLFRVACKLRQLKAAKSSSRNGLSRQRASRRRAGALAPLPASPLARPPREASSPLAGVGLVPGSAAARQARSRRARRRDHEAQGAQDHRRQVELAAAGSRKPPPSG